MITEELLSKLPSGALAVSNFHVVTAARNFPGLFPQLEAKVLRLERPFGSIISGVYLPVYEEQIGELVSPDLNFKEASFFLNAPIAYNDFLATIGAAVMPYDHTLGTQIRGFDIVSLMSIYLGNNSKKGYESVICGVSIPFGGYEFRVPYLKRVNAKELDEMARTYYPRDFRFFVSHAADKRSSENCLHEIGGHLQPSYRSTN